ncbi:MAG: hypothetical protein IPO15_25855 [Anaerolineae bacterium]|uniref:hypothetical protein n=1 Tax=Candidatus Amarolinea dominans TaxID=3140696 RepID=UPI003134682F|nr:hypothetical protein [Anaerolineae bacterium]
MPTSGALMRIKPGSTASGAAPERRPPARGSTNWCAVLASTLPTSTRAAISLTRARSPWQDHVADEKDL